MATLTVQVLDISTGVAPTYAAAAGGGDAYANDGRTYLHIKNASGGAITATIAVQQATITDPQFGVVVPAARTFSIGAGAERIVPFLAPGLYNDANGRVVVTYSGVTTLTVAAIQAPVQQ